MGVGRAVAAVLILLVLAGIAYYVLSRPAQPSAVPSYAGGEDVLEYDCGTEYWSDVVWCVYIYRNGTVAVTKSGRPVHTVDRATLTRLLLSPGREHVVELERFPAPANVTTAILLICSNSGGLLGCRLDEHHEGEGVWWSTIASADVFDTELINSMPVTATTLAGRLHTLDGVTLTEALWSRMAEYRGGDEAVWPYLEWLRLALTTGSGYNYVFDNHHYYHYARWGLIKVPSDDSVVRVGRVELPFGVEVVVTAYTVENGAVVVVHGTVANATEWMELLARFYHATFTTGPYFVEMRRGGITVEWALWRILLPARSSHIVVGDGLVPIKSVVVLLEMPAYMYYYYSDVAQATVWDYWESIEFAYWTLVHPAFAIAVRLANPPGADLQQLYTEYGTEFTTDTVLLGVGHPGRMGCPEGCGWTPFRIRKTGWGVCWMQTQATILFASNALGMYTAYVSTPGHALSALVNASSPTIDVDRDGVPESVVIVDTARYSIDYINKNMEYALEAPPFLATHFGGDPVYSEYREYRAAYYTSGLLNATLSLPGWLKAPWVDKFVEASGFWGLLNESITNEYVVKDFADFMELWLMWLWERGVERPELTYLEALEHTKELLRSIAEKDAWATAPPSLGALHAISSKTPLLHKAETPQPVQLVEKAVKWW